MYELVCVLDFEATCDQDNKEFVNEVIEFPSVLLKFTSEKELEVVSTVRKSHTKIIDTNLCKA